MKAESWITYRTRFLVKAKQLTSSLTFTDALGRQQSGNKGDYLVESSEGVFSIVSHQIFEDIYVPMALEEGSKPSRSSHRPILLRRQRTSRQCELPQPDILQPEISHPEIPPPEISEHEISRGIGASHRRQAPRDLPPQLPRKSPQPYTDRRTANVGLRSL
jgi:hypothetical protein